MALREILLHPDPRLKKVAEPVPEVTPELRRMADDMLETMYDAPGIGLAAPQIGVSRRLLVMDCSCKVGGDWRPMVLVNPEIVWASDELRTFEEGCLSIPEHYAEVERPAEVEVSWTDPDGSERQERFEEIWAICVQHEIDHLDGKLFIDHLKPLKRQIITRKMKKFKKERDRAQSG